MKDMKDTERRRPLPDAEADGVIEGRNAVIEALRVGTAIDNMVEQAAQQAVRQFL